MAGKSGGKKKGPSKKQQQKIWQLKALEPIYKATCRKHGIKPHKEFIEILQKKQEDGKPLDKTILAGPAISDQELQVYVECLKGYTLCKNLCLWGCNINSNSLITLAHFLRQTSSTWWKGSQLKLIEITNVGIGLEGEEWRQIYENMATNTYSDIPTVGRGFALPSFVLDDEPIFKPVVSGDVEDDDGQMQSPSEFGENEVEEGSYSNQFSLEALSIFGFALGARNLGLKVLVLDHINLGDNGIEQLSHGIRDCSSLKQLSIAYCQIGAHGMKHLAKAFGKQQNRSIALFQVKLGYINLQGNCIGGQGLINLCEDLENQDQLISINLANVDITEQDAVSVSVFMDVVKNIPKLTRIDFSQNEIGNHVASLYLQMLQEAEHVKALMLSHRIDRKIAQQIHEILMERNKKGKKKKKRKNSG